MKQHKRLSLRNQMYIRYQCRRWQRFADESPRLLVVLNEHNQDAMQRATA